MPNDNILDIFKEKLYLGEIDESFFSNEFVALRDDNKEYLKTVNEVIEHYNNFKNNNLKDIELEKEDSHFLMYFSINDTKYIEKIRLDENNKIHSVVEEKYIEGFKNIVLEIEYDGSKYFGIQKQNDSSLNTIQNEIELALKRMINKDVNIIISSRTDRGVHAKGQMVEFESFGIEKEKYEYALNNLLPGDIKIKRSFYRSQLFNCRYDTVRKTYEYLIDTSKYSVFKKDYVLYTKINDFERMRSELKDLLGTHDFVSFCKGENENTVRTIYEADLKVDGNLITLTFTGSGFLHNMIRFIVGALLEIDKTNEGSIKEIIESKDKKKTYKLADASGLYLIKIEY